MLTSMCANKLFWFKYTVLRDNQCVIRTLEVGCVDYIEYVSIMDE